MSERINPLQLMVDGFSAKLQKERALTQMTLGMLIAELSALPPDFRIKRVGRVHSYRGYYCDLAFEPYDIDYTSKPDGTTMPASELLAVCQSAMGRVFEGYKGGDFLMGETTPVWIAFYGQIGVKLEGLSDDGNLIVTADD